MIEITAARRAIGLIVPSSNRVVERVASRLLAGRPEIDCCIARVPYGGILDESGSRYRFAPFDMAAMLLADAGVDAICWNATRGAALGFAVDRELCGRLQDSTGIETRTTALATLDRLRQEPLCLIGLITQGDEVESFHVAAQFRAQGVTFADQAWLGISDNLDAANLGGGTLLEQAQSLAARSSLDTVLIWSTNLSGHDARLLQDADARFTILDSAEIGMLAALESAGFHEQF